jgi:hypothetical protein
VADVTPKLVSSHDHIRERWRWVEEAAIHDEYINLTRTDAGLLEKVIYDGEDNELCLSSILA